MTEPEALVVIQNMINDMLYWQRNNFVNLDWRKGLTKEATEQAIWILNKGETK